MALKFISYSILPLEKYNNFGARKMALTINSYSISILFILFFYSFYEFHLRHSEDGADFTIFKLSLSFFHYLLSLSILVL